MIPNGLKFFHYLNFKKSFQIVSKALWNVSTRLENILNCLKHLIV
jgi:hypothetical protein